MRDSPYTIDLVNKDGINEKGMDLLRKLSISRLGGFRPHKDSVMLYGEICTCDSAYLCEHRLQVIANWIKENQK